MCPRDEIQHAQLMDPRTFEQVLGRLSADETFRAVIAGFGEPTTHPRFMDYIEATRNHPVSFDMVSNGQQLDPERLQHVDGAIGTLIISFSSIDPSVYKNVHVNLDQQRVIRNIILARRLLHRTQLAISLTPVPECIPSLPRTIAWLRDKGVKHLTMSPTLYNRAGSLNDLHNMATGRLRKIIKEHRLHSQEFDFIPSLRDTFLQWRRNRFKCVPRNSDIFISAGGHYLYCFNDIKHEHPIGHVAHMGLREALSQREQMGPRSELCDHCNIRQRYRLKEVAQVALRYTRSMAGADVTGERPQTLEQA
jgi:MoaA/NifB/PqqE/SkfB family radical SAM enzyme